MRDSFIFYRSFYEAISDLPDEQQLEIYRAIASFSLDFKEPELTGISKTVFRLIKPNLEANNKRFENGKKPKQKQKGSKKEAKNKHTGSKLEANKDKDKDVDKDVDVNKDIDIDMSVQNFENLREPKTQLPLNIPEPKKKDVAPRRPKTEIPDKKEFMAYAREMLKEKYHDYEFSLDAKFDSWVAAGWKDGHGNKIISWKNKLRSVIPHLKPFRKSSEPVHSGLRVRDRIGA